MNENEQNFKKINKQIEKLEPKARITYWND